MRSRWVATGVAAVLVLAACSGGNGDVQPIPDDGQQSAPEPDVEEPDEPEPEEPEEPDDPFALPDEIDEDYLQLVTDELMAIRTDILRRAIIANEGGDAQDEEAISLIGSAFTGADLLSSNLNNFSDQVRATNLDDLYRQPDDLEPQRLTIVDVFEASSGCAVFTAEYDSSGIRPEPSDREPFFIVVLEHQPEAEDINPTGWKFRDEQRLLTSDEELASREQVEGVDADTVFSLIENECQAEEAA